MLQDPHALFTPPSPTSRQNKAQFLIVLNQPISCLRAFKQCYNSSTWKIYADGGANRVRDIELNSEELLQYPPTLITGDLDSVTSSTLQHYLHHPSTSSQPVLVVRNEDQYSTDFGKACHWVSIISSHFPNLEKWYQHIKEYVSNARNTVQELHELLVDLPETPNLEQEAEDSDGNGGGAVRDVIVFGSLGGRVDQGLGMLGEMAREEEKSLGRVRFWLVSERSVSWVLHERGLRCVGEDEWHEIQLSPSSNFRRDEGSKSVGPVSENESSTAGTSEDERGERPTSKPLFSQNVGILPIFGPTKISTRGLEWDVEDWETWMGGPVSTSNHVVSEDGIIGIRTEGKVLFTVEMGEELLGQESTAKSVGSLDERGRRFELEHDKETEGMKRIGEEEMLKRDEERRLRVLDTGRVSKLAMSDGGGSSYADQKKENDNPTNANANANTIQERIELEDKPWDD